MGGGNKSCAASIQVMNPLMNAQQRQKVEDESDEGRGGGEVSVPKNALYHAVRLRREGCKITLFCLDS